MPIASLIVKIGADLAELREKVKTATDLLGNMQGMIKTVGAALATYFTATAILGAVSALFDFAGQMTDLSARTGIAVEALQVLKFAGDQVGVSLQSVTGAVTALQNRLAEGDKSAVSALRSLGISFEDIRSKAPDQQMEMIAEAIQRIPDPAERTRLAMDLMGKTGAEIMPLLLSDFGEMAAKARELGLVMSDDTVAAMDDLGDSWTALKGVGMGLLAEVLKPFLPLLVELANGAMAFATGVRSALGAAQTAFEQLLSLLAGGMSTVRTWIADALEAANVGGVYTDAIKANRDAAAEWTAISSDLATTQTKVASSTREAAAAATVSAEAQREAAKHAKEIQQITDKLWGNDVLARAKDYAEAIETAGGKLPPLKDGQIELNKVMTEAIGVLEATGQGASALAKKYDELRLNSLQPLAASHLDISKMMAAVPQDITPESVPEIMAQKLADDAAEYFAEQDAFYATLAKEVAEMTPQIEKPISDSTDRMTQKWHQVGAAAQSALKLMVPENFSFSRAYQDAGFIVHGSLAGSTVRSGAMARSFQAGTRGYENFGTGTPAMLHGWEKVTPLGAGGDGITVHVNVDARESHYDTPASVQRMADRVGAAIVSRLRAQGVPL